MDDSKHFGRWLRSRRKLLDLTQHALAEQSGCTVGTIRKIEAGQRRPSQQLIERLAIALQIPNAHRSAFHLLARGQARVAPFIPLPASSNHLPPTDQTLPIPLTPLIGRDADCAIICDLVRRTDIRLLTVHARSRTSPAHIGKSEELRPMANQFPLRERASDCSIAGMHWCQIGDRPKWSSK